MAKTKVTSKFQVTIPREVREKVGIRPGEIVNVESVSTEEIVVKRFRRLKDPLKVLVGKTASTRHIPVEEIEEWAETR
jgi:AbrB family looped-hinge helix DNA binding protein